jgi:flagellar motility protein MotE (MotC chaperone)
MNRIVLPGKRRGHLMALPLVAACLLALAPMHATGVFRLLQATAEPAPPASSSGAEPAARPGPAVTPPARRSPLAVQRVPDGKLLEELNRRSAELDRREHELQTWATQVAVAERMARAQITELAALRVEIEKVVTRESAATDADLAVLVGLYSNMKPVQAAAVLSRLSAPKAAAILEKLDIHSAGPALAAMDPEVAVAITEELTHRHAALPQ